MSDEYAFLSEKEFRELDEKSSWKYVNSLKLVIDDFKIKAEKNCSECEQYHLDPGDLNIQMMFEDWRWCTDNCDKCGKEEQVFMCDLQFQVMSHIAEEMNSLRNKINGLVKYMLKSDDAGKKLVENFSKGMEDRNNSADGLYG